MLGLAVCAAALVSCGDEGGDGGGPPPPYRVERGAILDASGRALVLRGANVAGSQKQAPHIAAFGRADYARLRDVYGFDSMRFIMTWSAVEPAKGVYDDAYLDAVAERIGWARDLGMLVVLDMHQDLYGEGFAGGDGAPRWACDEARYAAFQPTDPWFFGYLDPNVIACVDALYAEGGEARARFVEAWRHVARRLARDEGIIGFDPLNEPNWGSYSVLDFEADKLAPFYAEVIRAVRAEAPGWLVFAEPSGSRNVGYPSHLPALPFDGVVYAPHSYDAQAEQGEGFDPSRRPAILQYVKDLRAEADAMGAALWIGEYGGMADRAGISAYMDAEYDAAAAVGAGSAYWAFDAEDGGYSLLAADGSTKEELADAIARPYPSRVAGALSSFDFDEASSVLAVRYTPDRGVTTPTEIVVPARAYPNGVAVECGGCDAEIAPGLVRLRTAPNGDAVTVTVRPR
jgi:endoglycosylceramidase